MSKSPFNTLGGVTPLKKGEKGSGSGKSRVRKQHAGDVGKRATSTRAQDKSGYSRSGGDFINVHSFTANTRLSSSLANTLGPSLSPAVGGKTKQTKGKTDDNIIGFDGNGNPIFLPPGVRVKSEIVETELPSFEEAYENLPMKDGKKYNKSTDTYYDNIQDFKDDAAKNPSKSGKGKKKTYRTVIYDANDTEIGSYDEDGEFSTTFDIEEQE